MSQEMDDADFERVLIAAAFELAAAEGWQAVSVARAARAGGLDLARARRCCADRWELLAKFGAMTDQTMLRETVSEGSVRDRLFDLLMRRIDVLQAHRAGVNALLAALPHDPATALRLACETRQSMRWALEAVGIAAVGLCGAIRARGLVAVWLWTVRAWRRDTSPDLAATMAALDHALRRAEQLAETLESRAGDMRASET
jgi:hypothetical protein